MPRQLQDGFGCVRPLSVITPIARGGTASDNAPDAVIKLGGISRSKIDVPLGVAGADERGYLKMRYLEAVGVYSGISLEGPTELVRSSGNNASRVFFFVSNFHTPVPPVIYSENDAVMDSLLIDWPFFSFNVPSVLGEVTLVINGREYSFPVVEDGIQTPMLQVAQGAVVPMGASIEAAKFKTRGWQNMGGLNWQLLPEGETLIPIGTDTHTVTVMGRAGQSGLIEVSDGQEVVVFPPSQAIMGFSPTYTGNYKVLVRDAGEVYYRTDENSMEHTASDWEISSNFAFTDVVHSVYGSAVHLNSLPITLAPGAYYIRVRHLSGAVLSQWSTPSLFTVQEDTLGLTEKSMTVDPSFSDGSNFGAAIATEIDGLMMVGAPTDQKSIARSGAVYAYRRIGYQSKYIGHISSVSGLAGENFGAALAIRGDDRIFVGAPGVGNGKVYFYDYFDGAFSLSGEISPHTNSHGFGTAIKVIDNHLFIGDPYDSTNGAGTGAVHVYDFIGGSYEYKGPIYPATPVNDGHFGCSIETDSAGDLLFIGATSPRVEDRENGMFYIFRKIAGIYSESEIRNSPMPDAGDGFGRSIAYDQRKGLLYVGCEHDSTLGEDAGAIFVFTVTAGGSLSLQHTDTLFPSNPNTSTRYGSALAVTQDGYCLYVGAPGEMVGTVTAGVLHCLA